MEVQEIQNQGCKFPRIGNGSGRVDSNKIGKKGDEQFPDEEEGEGGKEVRRSSGGGGGIGGVGLGSDIIAAAAGVGRLCGWPSSRIVRVSRASGGKDRHSKVLTSKGLRDRRVRLSVTTALQFYDVQDRLGYDQPSKAVEWLLKAAASSIAELPVIKTPFPETPKQQLSDEKRSSGGGGGTDHHHHQHGFDSVETDGDPSYQHQQQHGSFSKSACSSTSDTSKGSGLSLSRSESRIKARERARERAAEKEKEKESESRVVGTHHQNVNAISHNSSFTELLTGGISSVSTNTTSPDGSAHQNHGVSESDLFHKSPRQWHSTPMDYFAATGLLGPSSRAQQQHSSSHIHLGNSLPHSMAVSPFSITGEHHSELQHFSLVPENLGPVSTAAGASGYNLNSTISSGLAGFNRGTLQSNSPSFLPQLQRFSPIDGSSVPFFIGTAAPNTVAPVENHHHHHQFPTGFDGGLQLYYGSGGRHSDHKGKGKN